MADVNDRIKQLIDKNRVLLFMKGDATMPACGFSARAVQVLKALNVPFETVNVLADGEIREGIKSYSNWPTIPQLYVDGTFIGGSDIMIDMYQAGELQKLVEASR